MTNSPPSQQAAASELLRRREARSRLLAFCQYVQPTYMSARHLAVLTGYLEQVEAGAVKRLIITMPPRHGKSMTTSELFPAWFLARNPDKRVIIASYGSGLARKFSRSSRNLWQTNRFRALYPHLQLATDSKATDAWNVHGHAGGLLSAGVGTGITGHGADLLIIDDPIKDDAEASSELVRENLWDWYTTTAYTRLHPGGSVLVIATRWHEDDLIGKLISQTGEDAEAWTILHFPAVWEDGIARFRDDWRRLGHAVVDTPGMREGDALWPERYPVERMKGIRATVGSLTWYCLFQGTPIAPEGTLFKRGWFKLADASPREGFRVRYWDKAGTAGGGAYTAGVLLLRAYNGLFFVEDVVRGQWSEFERESTIRQTAELDRDRYGAVDVWVEQEPGSGGLDSVKATIRNLAGFNVKADRPSGDKTLRAKPFAAQAEAGNVLLVRAPWNASYLDELAAFPNGKYKDQVDASSGALSKLANVSRASMSKAL